MNHILIRFTSSKWIDSVLAGDLFCSSLSLFWDFTKGKINYYSYKNMPNAAKKRKLAEAIKYESQMQQDCSEGVGFQVPKDQEADFCADFDGHVVHDIRLRPYSYRFCNLLCFYRVDYGEIVGSPTYDYENISNILGGDASYYRALDESSIKELLQSTLPKNPLLNQSRTHAIKLPPTMMDEYGDLVIVIKDEEEFKKRVISAVDKANGSVVMGSVRYHEMMDRTNPTSSYCNSVSLITDKPEALDISKYQGVEKYGPLDKYQKYAWQKEWRVCWLSEDYNEDPKTLGIGRIDDIVDVVNTSDLRRYLLNKCAGYIPAAVNDCNYYVNGNMTYPEFMRNVECLDNRYHIIIDIG